MLNSFLKKKIDILVSTTVIEVGVDVPNASVIMIQSADRFGLSQLHQLRGRVGRSDVQAYAYLLVPAEKILSGVAHERIQVLQDLNDLGAGFKVASRDLEIRGAGNLLGSEQSGQITSVGLELYTQMVDRAVKKLLQTEFRSPRWGNQCSIENTCESGWTRNFDNGNSGRCERCSEIRNCYRTNFINKGAIEPCNKNYGFESEDQETSKESGGGITFLGFKIG